MNVGERNPDVDRISVAMGVLAGIARDSEDAVIATDTRGVIVRWNEAAERLFGYAEEEVLGCHITMLVPEEHQPEHRSILGEALAGSRVERYEAWRITKDQRVLDVMLTVVPLTDADGTVIGVSKIVRQITDVHEARRVQAQLAAIVENADDAIIAKDAAGTILSWNPAAERLFGYSAREAIGRPISMLVPPELRQLERNIVDEIVTGHRVDHFETRRLAKSGRTIDVSLTESPLRDVTGEIMGVSMIIRDITEQKRSAARERVAEDLAQANAELTAADLLKNQFLAMASHEMRTPLTAISGFTKTMLDMWGELSEEQKQEFVSIIDTQSHRLQRLVDDLLTMARIESGGVESRSDRMNVADALRKVVRELGTPDVEIDCPQPVYARGDEDQLQQILTNLIGNAMKYGRAPIVASARVDEALQLVELTVTDHGPGVPEDFVPLLFDRFSRVSAGDGHIKGTGLGLSITRGLAHAQGGDVSYQPNLPCGSRFVVHLPTPDGPRLERERRALPERRRVRGRRTSDRSR